MPWEERRIVDERVRFIGLWQEGEHTMFELAELFGVSRKTCYKWIYRYQKEGPSGLDDRSRSPRQHPATIDPAVIQQVIGLRQQHTNWGPRKLHAYLMRKARDVDWPAPSTIGKYLKRAGISVRKRRVRRTPAYTQPFVCCDRPNRAWCADFKGWFRTGDGKRCEPLTISDAFSRFALLCQAQERINGTMVKSLFERVFREYGMPEAIRTDNGSPFASVGMGGLSRLSAWWVRLGILPERIEPGHPEQNGRHERFHQTLKDETIRPPRATAAKQQECFDAFLREYNYERPHEALGNTTPAEWYQPSNRSYPDRLPEVEYSNDYVVRRVRTNGEMKWRGHLIYLSQSLIGEPVGLSR